MHKNTVGISFLFFFWCFEEYFLELYVVRCRKREDGNGNSTTFRFPAETAHYFSDQRETSALATLD